MRLQLDSPSLRPPESGPVNPAQSASTSSSRVPDSSGSRDSIGISGPSAALGRLSEERSSRVQQLAAAVRGGTYQVSAEALSAAIVAQSGA